VPEDLFRPRLGEPHHHAYLVEDIEATVNRLVDQLGAGPFFLVESVPLEKRFSGPRPRIHHVAYAVPPTEVADLRSSLDERGLPQYLSSQLGEVDTTLHDASAILGHDIEIHVDSEGLRGFFEMVRGAGEGWDGSQPLRPVES